MPRFTGVAFQVRHKSLAQLRLRATQNVTQDTSGSAAGIAVAVTSVSVT